MAKISALSAATTPLAGTELLPIVQTSTKKITVADFLAGIASPITTTDTTQSTSTITGSFVTAGGLGVAKNIWGGGTLNVTGAVRFGLNTITANALADEAAIQSAGVGGVSLLGPSANEQILAFGSPDSTLAAYWQWNFNSSLMRGGSNKAGATVVFAADADVANTTASGASGSQLLTAAGSVAITKFARFIPVGVLTIASGVITATGSNHTVDTEGAGASDDLDTINGGLDGRILTISAANDARTVVAKDGTGNLLLAGDFTMDNSADTLTLQYRGTNWCELCRSDNAA